MFYVHHKFWFKKFWYYWFMKYMPFFPVVFFFLFCTYLVSYDYLFKNHHREIASDPMMAFSQLELYKVDSPWLVFGQKYYYDVEK